MSPDSSKATLRDHGGNLGEAIARYGGVESDWIDLSTGIIPNAYPFGALSEGCWSRLPEARAVDALITAARGAYGVPDQAEIVAAPGCWALIRLMPRLAAPANVAIPGPTYNEHSTAFIAEGWSVVERPRPGVTASVIVNPNNPDGRCWEDCDLLLLAEALDLLVIDESFMDCTPDRSLIPKSGHESVVILRSFGKFFGLAGVRLGFAITGPRTAARLVDMLGPWAVSGPALEIGTAALSDRNWVADQRLRLSSEAARLREIGASAGWSHVGGTDLFRTFDTPDARRVQALLAEHRIWSRIFPYSDRWVRLGLPSGAEQWSRVAKALDACSRLR